jgi:hypothetical protein
VVLWLKLCSGPHRCHDEGVDGSQGLTPPLQLRNGWQPRPSGWLGTLPYLSDLAPADFFPFPTIKKQPAGKTPTQESFTPVWEGATRSITEEESTPPFGGGMSGARNVWYWGGYIEKSWKINYWKT